MSPPFRRTKILTPMRMATTLLYALTATAARRSVSVAAFRCVPRLTRPPAPSRSRTAAAGRRRRRRSEDAAAAPVRRTEMVPHPGSGPEISRVRPDDYAALLRAKVAVLEGRVRDAFSASHPGNIPARLPETEVFESSRAAFRMRANFKVWRTEDGSAHYVMFERGDVRTPHEVAEYPMGSAQLQGLMGPLLDAVRTTEELRERINDVRFLTTLRGDALITVTYNRPIGEDWAAAAGALSARLADAGYGAVSFVGRSRGVKLVVGSDTVRETLTVVPPPAGDAAATHRASLTPRLRYEQTEGAFSQPNAEVCEKMLGWAADATRGSHGHDLCELYCGNGCFTAALAPNFRGVVATETSKASVELARRNLAANDLHNVRVARLSAEDFVDAYAGVRTFQRLRDARIRLVAAGTPPPDGPPPDPDGVAVFDRLRTLFVDPPRAGLDVTCRDLARTFDRIVYVSCNPETLARDLTDLAATHRPVRLAAFDQFPYTPHLEAGVVLERRR
mmetsp:Transcript_19834/g.39525  ORF Transcript_19834/g.39525 Transcript_19834/m.39525 type:complete len:505 (+) Transcript_19834:107-1621(+)